jgi:hypothetical protein
MVPEVPPPGISGTFVSTPRYRQPRSRESVALMDLDELAGHWTLQKDERELVAGKRGPTRLGFALVLKFYARAGRFPRGRAELDDDAVAFVARQVGVPASDLGFYEWAGSTIEYHRAQIRRHLGFRECTAEDAGKLTEWLAAGVCQAERRADRVREELLARCRTEQVEPPSAGRCDRIVRSALHQAEQALTARVTGRLSLDASTRLAALAATAGDDEADGAEPSVLALIKSVPGNVSLESMLTEVGKLDAARAAGLPDGLFSGIAPRVVAAWRARAAVEAPSHLRDHPRPLMLTLVAALVHDARASPGPRSRAARAKRRHNQPRSRPMAARHPRRLRCYWRPGASARAVGRAGPYHAAVWPARPASLPHVLARS